MGYVGINRHKKQRQKTDHPNAYSVDKEAVVF